MVADAERNRAEDAALRQQIDARNELDSAAYQVERRLAELRRRGAGPREGPGGDAGRRRPSGDQGGGAARPGAVPDRRAPADVPRLLGERGQPGAPAGHGTGGPAPAGDDDVIDAEFTVR